MAFGLFSDVRLFAEDRSHRFFLAALAVALLASQLLAAPARGQQAARATPGLVETLETRTRGEATDLRLQLRGAPVSAGAANGPSGELLIYLANYLPGPRIRDIDLPEGLVSAVRVRPDYEAPEPRTVLTIETREPAKVSVLPGSGELRIRLEPQETSAGPAAGDVAAPSAAEGSGGAQAPALLTGSSSAGSLPTDPRLSAQMERLQEQLALSEEERASLSAQLDEAREQASRRYQREQVRQKVETLESERAAAQAEAEALRAQLGALEARLEEAGSDAGDAAPPESTEELAELREQLAAEQRDRARLEQELATRSAEATKRYQRELVRQKVAQLEEQLEEQLAAARDEAQAAREAPVPQVAPAEAAGEGGPQEVQRLLEELEQARKVATRAEEQRAELEARLDSAREEATRRYQRERARLELDSFEERAVTAEQQLAEARALAEASPEVATLTEALETSRRAESRLRDEVDRCREQLAEARTERERSTRMEQEPTAAGSSGIPAPAPRRVPAPAPNEPVVAPAPDRVSESIPAPARVGPAPERPSQAELEAVVRAWAGAWSGQRPDEYLAFYSARFVPPAGLDRQAWESQRRVRLTRPRFIQVEVSRFAVAIDSFDRAAVTFAQQYRSDTFEDSVFKTLVLVREGGAWRIVEERSVQR